MQDEKTLHHDDPETTLQHDEPEFDEGRLSTDDLVRDESPQAIEPESNGMREDVREEAVADDDAPLELFGQDEVESFRDEWREIQARFVDDPREAVQGADHLVAEVMSSLATTFNNHKHELEHQWQEGSDVQTEDLRQALRRYRTFFNQLLNA